MKWAPLRLTFMLATAITGFAQSPHNPAVPVTSIVSNPGIEIVSFKVGTNYNPLLESRPSIVSAENPDFPQSEAEKLSRRNAQSGRSTSTSTYNQPTPRGVIAPEDRRDVRDRGKLRSTIQILDQAEWVNFSLRNISDKPIKAIEWDFAFPRYESGKLFLRYDVSSKAEIKPGGKKSIKQKLPAEAKKCQIVSAEAASMEFVCGKGFNDPTQIKQEVVSVKKIEYADGSVWQRP